MEKKVALTIAGSDPSSGAGIQADLKSFNYLGVYGLTVITCVTSQNTKQVKKIKKLPAETIENQIDVLFEDFHIDTTIMQDVIPTFTPEPNENNTNVENLAVAIHMSPKQKGDTGFKAKIFFLTNQERFTVFVQRGCRKEDWD